MATLADYYIQIVPSAEGISGQLSSIMDSEASSAGTSASSSFGSSFSSGLQTVAKVGAVGFGVFTAAVGGATAELSGGISALADYTDHIDKQSQKMGMTAEAYQEWDAVLQHSGTSIDSMARGMTTLSKQAQSGSDAFAKLGISQEELASLNQEELFARTIEGLQGMEEGTERAALAQELLGGSSKELGALLNTSAEETQAMKDRVHELGGVLDEDAIKAGAAYKDSLQDMSTAFTGLKNNMLSDFLPSVTTVMDGLTEIFSGNSSEGIGMITEGVNSFIDNLTGLIPQLSEIGGGIANALITAISENSDSILNAGADVIVQLATSLTENLPMLVTSAGDIIFKLMEAFLQLLPELAEAGVEILENLMNGVAENIDTIIPTIVDVVLQITQTLIEHLPDIIDAGLQIAMGVIEGVIEAIPVIVEMIPTLIDSIANTLIESADMILDGAMQMFLAIVDAIPDIITALADALPQIIDSITEFLTGDGLPKILDGAIKMLMAIVEAIPQIVTALANALPSIISSIISFLTKSLPQIISAGVTLLGGLIKAIPQVVSALARSIPQIIKAIVNALKNGLSQIVNVGRDLLTGLWNGIQDKVGWILDKVKGVGNSIIEKVNKVFGRSSPSKVFKAIGKDLALGLGIGWDDEMEKVNKKIGEDIDYKGNIVLGTTFDDSVLTKLDDITAVTKPEIATVTVAPSNDSLEGMKLTIEETIDLGDTELKRIVSDYTIRRIGSDLRAVKIARGGNNVL